jgi:PIN domain nuclease of toxin-antitoxin system
VSLLLDTCTVLWLARGDAQIPPRVRSAIASDAEVWVSAASAWEIAIKHAMGQLRLPVAVNEFVGAVRERYQFKSLPIDEESALLVAKLPPIHRDPFDRILVSQAIVHGLTIVTPDSAVTGYPVVTMWL